MVSQSLFLIGPMGAGKTAVGKLLAKILKFDFYDSDQVIEEQSGVNIAWIFDIEGEEGFRLRESKAIDELTQKKQIVLATGGGAILNPDNRLWLKNRGTVIYLQTTVDEQIRRTDRSRNRPLIHNKNARDVFEKLKAQRESYYREVADYTLDTENGSLSQLVAKILSYLNIEIPPSSELGGG